MSKKHKDDETNRGEISFEISPQLSACLDQMVELGLWGDTVEEVCVTLIREGIRRHWRIIAGKALDA